MNIRQLAIFILGMAPMGNLHATERQPASSLREYLIKITPKAKTPSNIYELLQLMIVLHKLNPEDITDTEMLRQVVTSFGAAQVRLNKLQEEKNPLARLILDKFSLKHPEDLQQRLKKIELSAVLHLRKLRAEIQKAIEEKEVTHPRPPEKTVRAEKPGARSADAPLTLWRLIEQRLAERRKAMAEDESE